MCGDANLEITPDRISTDTRTISRGDLFVALSGHNFDGNAFVVSALEKGALGAIVSRAPSRASCRGKLLIKVKDTTKAYQELASRHRKAFALPVVAVTGSNGKTTVKDMAWTVLSGKYNVLRSDGTKNNHIGVPQTLLGLTENHQACVIEIGTNHEGEIAALSRLAAPTIAVITNIGPSHLESFGDLEGVFRAKTEILASMGKSGIVIINGDDEYLARIKPGPYRIFSYGFGGANDINAKLLRSAGGFVELTVEGKERYALNVLGRHNAYNALAAITVGRILGVGYKRIRQALSDYKPTERRMALKKINGVTVIDDSYNSNPLSMSTAIESIRRYPARERWVVTGDMMELGKMSKRFHEDVGDLIVKAGVNGLLTIGELSRSTYRKAVDAGMEKSRARHCSTHEEAAMYLKRFVRPGDLVLVKGSRAMRMEEVLKELTVDG